MAVIKTRKPAEKPPSRWRAPLHVLTLFVLAAGIVVAGIGLQEAQRTGELSRENLDAAWVDVHAGFGLPAQRGLWLLVWGTAAALFAFLFELLVFLPAAARGQRPFGPAVAVRFFVLLVLLLLGVAGVAAAVLLGLPRLQQAYPPAGAAALFCPFSTVTGLESRRWH
jgi:hypothetical protein